MYGETLPVGTKVRDRLVTSNRKGKVISTQEHLGRTTVRFKGIFGSWTEVYFSTSNLEVLN